MAETLGLFEERRRTALADREQERIQQEHRDRADTLHALARVVADDIGRKTVAAALGLDLSTISNQLSCCEGRGFPSARLLDYLGGEAVRRGDFRIAVLLSEHWNLKQPEPLQKPETAEQKVEKLQRSIDSLDPDIQRLIYERAGGKGWRP